MKGPNNLLASIESVHIQIESDTEEINRLLRKIELCLGYVIIELENHESEFYNQYGKMMETVVTEILNKIKNLIRETKLNKF
mgnify:CR=1 FL=1